MKCLIYRCLKKQEMYLYIPFMEDEQRALSQLPDQLNNLTGRLEKVMELELTPQRKLARVDSADVIEALSSKGFYLQMPPADILAKDISVLDDHSDTF